VATTRRSVEFRREGFSDYDRCDGHFFFGGEEREINRYDRLIIFRDDLEKCRATDLQAALRRARTICEEVYHPLSVVVSEDDFYDENILVPENIRFEMLDDALTLALSFGSATVDERTLQQVVQTLLEPLLRRHRMTIVQSVSQELPWPPKFVLQVSIGFNTRERTLRELYDIGQDAYALIGAMRDGPLTRQTAGDLIRAGHANVLIGQPEGQWLEVKEQNYDLSGHLGKITLAQDVACFCNAEEGGLLIVGMESKKVPIDEIRRLCPVPRDKAKPLLYQSALEQHLHPPPDNLSIESVDMPDNGMLILIDVPPQPEERKPFLVHGAIVDGKVRGAFISIVRRRGESSIPTTAREIHSTLAAGRALLRRGELPRDS
jgi:hypothetical protein